MNASTVVAYAVFALLIAQGIAPSRLRWPLLGTALLVAAGLIFLDTPPVEWPVKLAAWLVISLLALWRWRRERANPGSSAPVEPLR